MQPGVSAWPGGRTEKAGGLSGRPMAMCESKHGARGRRARVVQSCGASGRKEPEVVCHVALDSWNCEHSSCAATSAIASPGAKKGSVRADGLLPAARGGAAASGSLGTKPCGGEGAGSNDGNLCD